MWSILQIQFYSNTDEESSVFVIIWLMWSVLQKQFDNITVNYS